MGQRAGSACVLRESRQDLLSCLTWVREVKGEWKVGVM